MTLIGVRTTMSLAVSRLRNDCLAKKNAAPRVGRGAAPAALLRAITMLRPLVLRDPCAVVPWERAAWDVQHVRREVGPCTRVSQSSFCPFFCLRREMGLNLTGTERVTSRAHPTTGGCIGNFNAIIDCIILVNINLRLPWLGRLFSGEAPFGTTPGRVNAVSGRLNRCPISKN